MTTDLFSYTPPTPPQTALYARGSATSREAAESIEHALPHLEQVVFDAIVNAGAVGATCDQIEVRTSLSHQTASARVNGLVRKRRIEPTGERRATRSGRSAQVYVARGSAA